MQCIRMEDKESQEDKDHKKMTKSGKPNKRRDSHPIEEVHKKTMIHHTLGQSEDVDLVTRTKRNERTGENTD